MRRARPAGSPAVDLGPDGPRSATPDAGPDRPPSSVAPDSGLLG